MDQGESDRTAMVVRGQLSSDPAMPVVAASELNRGAPFLMVQYGQPYSIGWQDTRKEGPCFVVARISRLDTVKVTERFPMTEAGWAKAWRGLVRVDAESAREAAARLAARAAEQQAASELAELNAASAGYLPAVIFLGGYGPEDNLAVGKPYDVRFLEDRIMVLPANRVGALVELPYRDVEAVDIGGPGLVRTWSPGEQAALAIFFGLPGALLAATSARIQTIVRINSADWELFFRDSHKQADAWRIELSAPLKAIRDARAAQSAKSGPAAPGSVTDQLTRLASMLESGLLTRNEFDKLKAKLIAES
ncbi:MAG TPA: SHOCT domain-containing protein [Streptosporangiaceae bacterium]|nr:SHOCT domain-containing protein [Streptosporangiaceae bacterium]